MVKNVQYSMIEHRDIHQNRNCTTQQKSVWPVSSNDIICNYTNVREIHFWRVGIWQLGFDYFFNRYHKERWEYLFHRIWDNTIYIIFSVVDKYTCRERLKNWTLVMKIVKDWDIFNRLLEILYRKIRKIFYFFRLLLLLLLKEIIINWLYKIYLNDLKNIKRL